MEPAELVVAGKASVFLAYLEATCSAEPFFPAGPPKVRIAPNGASCCLLANSACLSLKKMVRCTCFPFWEPFHVLFSVLQLCTCKLSLLLGRGAGSLVRALDPSGREEVGWMWVCTVTPPALAPLNMSMKALASLYHFSCLQAARLALGPASRAAAAGSRSHL